MAQESIRDLLEKHLPAKSKEKSDLGEVFTPPAMISNMYDYFPKEFMSRSTTFWTRHQALAILVWFFFPFDEGTAICDFF